MNSDEDDELLLNPIHLIDKYESENEGLAFSENENKQL